MSWCQFYWAVKVTKVLKELDPVVFETLAARISDILGKGVRLEIIVRDDQHWRVKFNEMMLDLSLCDYRHASEFVCGYRCDTPTVCIDYISIHPPRKGLGSTIFRELVLTLREAGFKRIVIMSKPEAREFWLKMGFQPHEEGPPDMKLELASIEGVRHVAPKVRLSFSN